MSARSLRRALKEHEERRLGSAEPIPAPDDDGDEEEACSPGGGGGAAIRNPFDLLEEEQDVEDIEINSGDMHQDNDVKVENTCVRESSNVVPASKSKSKKKKKKDRKESMGTKPSTETDLDVILGDLGIDCKPTPQLTTIHQEESACKDSTSSTLRNHISSILSIDAKYLKAENELRKIFGSKVVSSFENNHGAGTSRQVVGGRRPVHNPRKTVLITPPSFWSKWDGSLSMELLETKDGINYFRYVHSSFYSHVQEAFEVAKAANDLNAIASILAPCPFHIDSLLTLAEIFKFSGEHQSSADAIGKCLYALECAWHPMFSPLHGNFRLKYIHDTNKSFFSALFSHMRNMDRRGCHRTALEVCKFLLSLDSDDPKGALFCIDYFSLRAQEHGWLERFAEDYRSDNSIWLFPNFAYSLSICRFYLEREHKSQETSLPERESSLELLKQALMLHPLVLQKLVAKAPLKDAAWTQILKNPFFGSAKAGGDTLDHLINIYVERNFIIWRFPELQNLLKEAAFLVIEALNQDSSEAKDWFCVRREAFKSEKNEYSHLLVSDFSDMVPSLPAEELRPLMMGPVGPQGVGGEPDRQAEPAERAAPREVAGRNAALVFLESLLPWMDYGQHDDREHDEGHNEHGE